MILVTGSAGFIGSNFVLDWLAQGKEEVIGLDKLTYAGNLENLASLKDDPRHIFVRDFVNAAAQELGMNIRWEGQGVNEVGFLAP